jgi:predicted ArsR family transcriptional regulator
MDTASLARSLGISITAVKNRATKLGLVPEEVSSSSGKGRPKQIWSAEQVEQISNPQSAAQAQNHDQWVEDSEASGQVALYSAQAEMAVALQSQLSAFDLQCEDLENRMAQALAARASIVPARAWGKTNQLLRSGAMGIDMVGFSQISLTPRVKSLAGDRFPESV